MGSLGAEEVALAWRYFPLNWIPPGLNGAAPALGVALQISSPFDRALGLGWASMAARAAGQRIARGVAMGKSSEELAVTRIRTIRVLPLPDCQPNSQYKAVNQASKVLAMTSRLVLVRR